MSGIEGPILESLAARLGSTTGIDAAYLLGSAASGQLRPDSDVDIALLPTRGASFTGRQLAELAADLESIADRPVDLGILNTGNLVYAKEAVSRGHLFHERDPAARRRFAMHVLSMYADLQENRREILDAYAA
ncbi:MAG: type VII toxin-antitoxin system MntA family adenylyltransferase antitoxin [Verrucomicrobiota bacterium]|jgi:predicted nucleotidyltransferase